VGLEEQGYAIVATHVTQADDSIRAPGPRIVEHRL
jgi:hypothetical protein